MKRKKDIIYEFIHRETFVEGKSEGVETSYISERLGLQRSNVSALLNKLVKEQKLTKTSTRPVLYQVFTEETSDKELQKFPFLIGENDSLRKPIQLAKAAILYPKPGLPTVIASNPGAGRSMFVKHMYEFALKNAVLDSKQKFLRYDCQFLEEDTQQILDLLMNNPSDFGFIFIDNAHLMDVKTKSQVLKWVEEGSLQGYLLAFGVPLSEVSNFAAKVPVIIELPELEERSLSERFELINHFFSKEAVYARKNIQVAADIICILLSMKLEANIRELRMIIKTACANAYVRSVDVRDNTIIVTETDLNITSKKRVVRTTNLTPQLINLLAGKDFILYDRYEGYMENIHSSWNYFYSQLQKQYLQLAKKGIELKDIQELTALSLKKSSRSNKKEMFLNLEIDKKQLSRIVDEKIIKLVEKFLVNYYQERDQQFNIHVFYSICLHLNAILHIQSTQHRIKNEQVVHIIKNFPDVYIAAGELGSQINQTMKVKLSMEEIIILAMFLIDDQSDKVKAHPVLLYVFHGNGTASSLKDVTNAISQHKNAYSYDFSLTKEVRKATKELTNLIQQIDEGAGILVIYDMGSIRTILEDISQKIAIKIRLLEVPITMIGIEAARKCAMISDIDDIYHELKYDIQKYDQNAKSKRLIITLCHTGEGGAQQLKNYIDQYSRLGYKVVALAISDKEELLKEVIYLKKIYKIHAFVGTYDPKIFGIPFISIKKVFQQERENLDRLLSFIPIQSGYTESEQIYNFLSSELKYTSMAKLKDTLPAILDRLDIYYNLDEERRIGLFMHLAALVERKLSGKYLSKEVNYQLLDTFKEDCKVIQRNLRALEKEFTILIDDYELMILLITLKQL